MNNARLPRLYSLDRAKGLAILLVVIGHIVARGPKPEDAEWFFIMRRWIYLFHMPFFMFTSGAIFYYTYKEIGSGKNYISYAVKKIERLLPPFLAFGILILVGKTLAKSVMHVDNTGDDFLSAAIDIVLRPSLSVAGSLWYIYVLLELYLLIPILLLLTRANMRLLFIVSLIIHFLPVLVSIPSWIDMNIFMLNRLSEYILYFVTGMILMKYYKRYTDMLNAYWVFFMIVFLASFFSAEYLDRIYAKTIIGICSIPAIHGLVSSDFFAKDKLLLLLAKYTFVIYLLNTVAIGVAKGIMLKFVSWHGDMFYLYFIALSAAGIIGPILAKIYIFDRSAYLARMTN